MSAPKDDLITEVLLMRDAAAVKRYHTVRTHHTQSIGEHTFGAILLLRAVYPEAPARLLWAVMYHDLPELVSGDIPAPAKRMVPKMAVLLEELERGTGILYGGGIELTQLEERLLKWVDLMELILFSLEELQMGNSYARGPLRNGLEYLWGHMTGWGTDALPAACYQIFKDTHQWAAKLGVHTKEQP